MAADAVFVENAEELVYAIADNSVKEVVVSADCDVTDAVWSLVQKPPVLIKRNLNISGDPSLPSPPAIRLNFLKAKIKLAGGVTLSFRNVALYGGRADSMLLAPGLDILAPTDKNSCSTLILGPPCAWISVTCLPHMEKQRNWEGLQRPPDYPGQQLFDITVPQDGCINDTSAPILERCWLDRGFVTDVVGAGLDTHNSTGLLIPNNIIMVARNVTTFCQHIVDKACLQQFSPYYCLLSFIRETTGGTATSSGLPRTAYATAQSPPSPLGVNSMATTQASSISSSSPSSLHPGSLAGVVGGAVAGAIILLLAVLLVTAILQRRWQHWYFSESSVCGAEAGMGPAAAGTARGACCWKITMGCHHDPINGSPSTVDTVMLTSNQYSGGDKAAATDCSENKPSRLSSCSSTKEDAMEIMTATVPLITETSLTRPAVAADSAGTSIPCWLTMTEVPVTLLTPPRVDLDLNISLKRMPTQMSSNRDGSFSKPPPGQPALPTIMEADPAALVGGLGGPVGSPDNPAAGAAAAAGVDGWDSLDKEGLADIGLGMVGGLQNSPGNAISNQKNIHSGAEVTTLPVVRGCGAFGRVVEGLYQGQRVAVKIMAADAGLLGHCQLPSAAAAGSGPPSNPQKNLPIPAACGAMKHADGNPWDKFIGSFLQEVQVLGRCTHPNVVRLLAACVTPPRLCLVMELMEASLDHVMYGKTGVMMARHQHDGCTASNNCSSCNAQLMPLPKVVHVAICICRALAYLHPTVSHRDLKPANVLVNDPWGDKPVVKLSDFGLARLWSTGVATRHPDAGTPPYMAPECFDLFNGIITHKADIYSLGVLLWEMLSGERPWNGLNPLQIGLMVTFHSRRLPLDALSPSRCPARLRALLRSCWERDPQRRPAAAEVANELTAILAILPAEADAERKAGDVGGGGSAGDMTGPGRNNARTITTFSAATSSPLSGSDSGSRDSRKEEPPPWQRGGCESGGVSLRVFDIADLKAAKAIAKPASAMAGRPGTSSPMVMNSAHTPPLQSFSLSSGRQLSEDFCSGEGLGETRYRSLPTSTTEGATGRQHNNLFTNPPT